MSTIATHFPTASISHYFTRPIFVRLFRIFFTSVVLAGTLGVPYPLPCNAYALSPPVLQWHHGGCRDTWCRTGWYASPAVADLDQDGLPEVIWTDYRILAVNGADGSTKWAVSNPGDGRGWPGVVVADLTGHGSLQIVTAHSGGYLS
ncbi:MAG: VCBS repeat-containing protein, partial [Desulfobacterota bacterium]|nr:VCBS repeat-containing protein [Thermodesulfobacteriota bacterium]